MGDRDGIGSRGGMVDILFDIMATDDVDVTGDFREGGLGEVDKRKIGFFGRECAVEKQEKKGKQESHGSALVGNIFLK